MIEVVNLGIVALAARQVALLAEEVARDYSPDVLLVYSGNNEFLEIHARKYAERRASALERIGARVARTHLYRLIASAVSREPSIPVESRDSRDSLRLTESALIRDIELEPEEVRAIHGGYADALERIATAAREADAALVLMTVASNWRWRGREDLPENWLDEWAAPDGRPTRQRLLGALATLRERLAAAPLGSAERWELLFRRAVAAEALGDFDASRADYRAAMNADPHRRRATDPMAEIVRETARRRQVALVDVIAGLGRRAPRGTVGFETFYDYVHFTPRGAALVADLVFRTLVESGIAPAPRGFDPEAHLATRLRRIAELTRDPFDVDEWLGVGFGNECRRRPGPVEVRAPARAARRAHRARSHRRRRARLPGQRPRPPDGRSEGSRARLPQRARTLEQRPRDPGQPGAPAGGTGRAGGARAVIRRLVAGLVGVALVLGLASIWGGLAAEAWLRYERFGIDGVVNPGDYRPSRYSRRFKCRGPGPEGAPFPANCRSVEMGVALQTNPRGLNDRPVDEALPHFRVAVLGDSMTVAEGVPTRLSYHARLEEQLDEELGRPGFVELYNLSGPGKATSDYAEDLERALERLPLDAVLVGVSTTDLLEDVRRGRVCRPGDEAFGITDDENALFRARIWGRSSLVARFQRWEAATGLWIFRWLAERSQAFTVSLRAGPEADALREALLVKGRRLYRSCALRLRELADAAGVDLAWAVLAYRPNEYADEIAANSPGAGRARVGALRPARAVRESRGDDRLPGQPAPERRRPRGLRGTPLRHPRRARLARPHPRSLRRPPLTASPA